MLTSLSIENLRGIRSAKIEGLAPLTVFVGANGSGKSTVLEAAGLLCAQGSMQAAFDALFSREWLGLAGVRFTISNEMCRVSSAPSRSQVSLKVSAAFIPSLISIAHGQGEKGPFVQLDLDEGQFGLVNEDGVLIATHATDKPWLPFSLQSATVDRPAGARKRFADGHFSSELRTALSAIKLSPWYPQWLELLKLVRPSLTSVESIAVGDRDEPFVFEGGGAARYPLAYAGDGFRRSLRTAATLASATGGIAALDEPEAFAHPSLQGSLAKLIRGATEKDVQVLVSTHSLEFVRTLAREFESAMDRFAIVGLRRVDEDLDAITFAGPDAYERLVSYGDDLRL